ncbi:MAG: serine/threonine protein phosphatase [Planctomycetota bacterium]|nr:MAG: serine/threonine protein phosphatase [Planctomycetota bacterium]REK46740.1 MAG: serine/threonine protein phosphatase [Planctomycetota bacterium]
MAGSFNQDRLFLSLDMDVAETISAGNGTAAVYSRRCPGKETGNEDSAGVVLVDHHRSVLIVADGLGGSPAGDQAARLAVAETALAIREVATGEHSLRVAIVDGFERANEKIQALGVGAATTLSVVELDASTMRPYHVGDSVIMLLGGRGKIKYQSVSHSPVGYLLEAGHLDEADAMQHEDRHLVSNTVGEANMRIEIGPALQLAPRDTLLVATDGLADNLHVNEIVERVRRGPLDRAMQRLIDDATERMHHSSEHMPSKPDDLTAILYRPSTVDTA